MFKVLTAFLLILLSASQILAQEPSGEAAEEAISERDQKINEMLSEMTEEEGKVFKKFLSLDWKVSGTHHLAESHSSITLPEGYSLVLGNDAKREQEMPQSAPLEAVVYDETYTNSVLFSNFKSGYISLDNWNKIDSMAILESVKKCIEQGNEERKNKGISELFIEGWIQQPILDRATNTVCWAIGFKDKEGRDFVNSGAIRLYRQGFETIGWMTERASFVLIGGHLDNLLQAHSFDSGFQYKDYDKDDQIAEDDIVEVVEKLFAGEFTLPSEVSEKPGTHKLKQSHSTLYLPEGFKLIKGNAAKELIGIYCEAAVFDAFDNMITFEDFKGGYLFLDNWDKIEPISLMERVKENEKIRIEEQVRNGEPKSSKTLGWLQTPWLDKHKNTIYWAIEITDGKRRCLNSVALKLYREGSEKITLSTENVSSFVPFGGPLDIMVKSHSFDPGFQYKDYEPEDLTASDGIAGAVAMFLGVDIDIDEDLEGPQSFLERTARVIENSTKLPRYVFGFFVMLVSLFFSWFGKPADLT